MNKGEAKPEDLICPGKCDNSCGICKERNGYNIKVEVH
jgi:hypothetical protein